MQCYKLSNENYQNELSAYLNLWEATQGEITTDNLQRAISDFRKEWKERLKEQRLREKEERDFEIAEEKRCDNATEIATKMDLPMDWENIFDNSALTEGVKAETPADALILSMNNLGRVDIEYMASITGLEYKDIIRGLKGSIYQNPDKWDECFFKGWETKDEYLSGNLKEKWNTANNANNKYKGYFENNLKAIEGVMPPSVTSKDIYVTLGSPWVPTDIIDQFVLHLFGRHSFTNDVSKCACQFDEVTGIWHIPNKTYLYESGESARLYGTSRVNALNILEKTLNGQSVDVYDEVSVFGSKKRILNARATAFAMEKQNMMIKTFKNWVWRQKDRKARLEEIYENRYAAIRTRKFDGSFLTFPNMSKDVSLYPYQKDAVARIIFSPNTLLAHDVGSGKTYVMVASGMELKRMGLSKKNLYVVPNNIICQWRDIFLTLYPKANILCIAPKDFVPKKRQKVLENIRDNDYDAIIMGYSSFSLIPLSFNYYLNKLKDEKAAVEKEMEKHPEELPSLKQKLKTIGEKTAKILVSMINKSALPYFDELGITRLYVDEAHNFKNVPLDTRIQHVYGLNANGSKKCQEMLEKVRFVQQNNNGGGVVFATGTPITNSLTDLFVMQKYLENGILATLDINNFDNWIGMFAESESQFEVDVDTTNYRLKTRFSKFHNLPELTSLLSMITDFHHNVCEEDLPEFNGYTDEMVERTKALSKYIDNISLRADRVRNQLVKPTQDNMLKITTDGRKAALDLRLVLKFAPFSDYYKAGRCAENVSKIYFETEKQRCTQLIFCDISVPSDKFNLYTDMAKRLTKLGVKREEIAFIHDAETDSQREALFEKVRKGEIRILMGSTFKLGIGVNVQDKLIAIHHLDVPWRPSDMVQREGRIIRPGNTNKEVKIFRYITKGSFDAYSWQLLETKQMFISALLSGFVEKRSEDDVDDTVLNYAEVKALAVNNPLLKKRIETANELRRAITLRDRAKEERESMEIRLEKLPSEIEEMQTKLQNSRLDAVITKKPFKELEFNDKKEMGSKIISAVNQNIMADEDVEVLSYRGFKIFVPSHMLAERPYINIVGSNKYSVDIANSDVGVIMRIDNFLNGFKDIVDKFNQNLKQLKADKTLIESKLALRDSYGGKVERLKAELKKLDKELGVIRE